MTNFNKKEHLVYLLRCSFLMIKNSDFKYIKSSDRIIRRDQLNTLEMLMKRRRILWKN